LSSVVRAALFIGALTLIVAGIALLTNSSAQQNRLGRLAGIIIVIALVMLYGAVRGRF
jgi:hypothetical protein